jgi:flagellar hook-associated protein 2
MASVSTAGLAAGMDIHPPGKTRSRTELNPSADLAIELDNPPAQLSAEGKRQSAAASFLDAAQQLMDPATWMATQALSSRPDVVTAVSSPDTPRGDYRVEVKSLASAQTVSSASFSGLGTTIGLGTLNLEVGTWNGSQSAFLTNPNWPKASLTIGPKDNSLERVRDRINASGVGVVASVISDATGSRLVLRASGTGSSQGFKVDAKPDDAAAAAAVAQAGAGGGASADQSLQALGFNPSANEAGMMQVQTATDAQATVNQQALSSSSNTVFKAEDGLSLQLHQLSDEPVTISVGPHSQAIARSVSDFVQRYNELASLGDSGSGDAGHTITSRMQQAFSASASQAAKAREASSPSLSLQDIGLRMGPGQLLDIDAQRLQHAVQTSPDKVRAALGQGRPDSLAQRFRDMAADASAAIAAAPAVAPPAASPTDAPDATPRMLANPTAARRLLAQYMSLDTPASGGDTGDRPSARTTARPVEPALSNNA